MDVVNRLARATGVILAEFFSPFDQPYSVRQRKPRRDHRANRWLPAAAPTWTSAACSIRDWPRSIRWRASRTRSRTRAASRSHDDRSVAVGHRQSDARAQRRAGEAAGQGLYCGGEPGGGCSQHGQGSAITPGFIAGKEAALEKSST